MDSDGHLIRKMKQGEEDAWETFIRRYYGDILKYCHFHCLDQSYAEDLTQEVFLKFFAALPRYRHSGRAKNYLYTIAANLCRDLYRKPREFPLPEREREVSADEGLLLRCTLLRLPKELQDVMILHYYQGLTLSETAVVLRIGLPLAKYRLKRGKELLRKELADKDE